MESSDGGEKSHTYAPSPEQNANLFSKTLFFWITPIVKKGKAKPLENEDLPALSNRDQSSDVFGSVNKNYAASKSVKPSLFHSMRKSFGTPFYMAGVLKLIHDILQFMGPMLLKPLLNVLNDDTPDIKRGMLLAVGMFAASVIQSICLRNYFFLGFRTGLRLRSGCITMIYDKSLKLSAEARAKFTTGEILNLMEIDSVKFQDITGYLHTLWSGPFQIIGSLILLFLEVQWATFAGLLVIILSIVVTRYLAAHISKVQREWMKTKDKRVNQTTEVLSGVKIIKLKAWEDSFLAKVNGLRSNELGVQRRFVKWNSISSLLWLSSPIFVAVTTFAVYTLWMKRDLPANSAMTCLVLFNLLRFPLHVMPGTINNLTDWLVSLRRIENFLQSSEVVLTKKDNRKNKGITIIDGQFQWVEGNSQASSAPPSARAVSETPTATQSPSPGGTASPQSNASNTATQQLQPEKTLDAPSVPKSPTSPREKEGVVFSLKDINVEMEMGTLTAIVGPVGCGKSTLLNAILGEAINTSSLAGSQHDNVLINGSISYVSQTPFIMNTTLKNNILFGQPLSESLYESVVQSCALSPDLAILPAGDQTEIGEKGINLSGGQKARISLARSVYNDSDIYLLDDPLSAVDAHVARHLFTKCIRSQLKSKCVVLVTHTLEFLPYCDRVIVMNGGRVVNNGTFAELEKETSGVFYDLMQAQDQSHKIMKISPSDSLSPSEPKSPSASEENPQTSTSPSTTSPSTTTTTTTPSSLTPTSPSTQLATQQQSTAPPLANSKITTVESREIGGVKRNVYWMYFDSLGGWPVVVYIILLFFIAESVSVANQLWVTQFGSSSSSSVSFYIGVYAILGVVYILITCARIVSTQLIGMKAGKSLHESLLRGVMYSPMSFFDSTPLGRITNRISKDIFAVDRMLPEVFSSLLSNIFVVSFTLIIAFIASPYIIIGVIFIVIYYVYYLILYVRSSREIKRLDSISRSPIYAQFGETLDGAQVIRAFNKQDSFTQRSNVLLDDNQRAYFIICASNCWLGIRLEFSGAVLILLIALLNVLLPTSNPLFVGIRKLALVNALSCVQSLNWLVRMVADVQTQIVAVERIKEYSVLPSEAPAIIESNRPPVEWPAHGVIQLDNVSVRYREGLDSVLKHITVQIHEQEKIGVVGRTGAGKSSLTLALMRIIEPHEGSMVIDGVNTQSIGLFDLRSRIAIIPQDPLLFSGTVRSNLDPFNHYTDEELWSCLDRSCMREAISEITGGLDCAVDEKGSNFSVGQRQLLCISRALLTHSRVLLMDEATANIDLETDLMIQKTIREEFKECTVITIAHRIHTIIDCDRVLVMDNGYVREFDSPSVLLEDEKSLFKQLHDKSKHVMD